MHDQDEAICESALAVFKAHVLPENDGNYNARWIEAALGICVAWLLKVRGEEWTRHVFETAVEYYADETKN